MKRQVHTYVRKYNDGFQTKRYVKITFENVKLHSISAYNMFYISIINNDKQTIGILGHGVKTKELHTNIK